MERQLSRRKKLQSHLQAQKNYKQKIHTPAEAQVLKTRRAIERKFTVKVNQISETVYLLAEELHAEYSQHPATKIYQNVMQHARKSAKKRCVNG